MKTNRSKQGFAILTVLFIMTALALSLGMLIQSGSQRSFSARHMTHRAKALAYSEAGIDYAYSILSADFDSRHDSYLFSLTPDINVSNYPLTSTYAQGSFDLSLTLISNRYVVVTSVGESGGYTHQAEALVEDIYAGSGGSTAIDYESMDGFNYAILSGGDFNFRGSGSLIGPTALMHSNSEIDINGSANTLVNVSSTVEVSVGNNTVNGTITAPSVDLHRRATVTGGSTTASVPPVAIPDIDFTPYYTWAAAKGEVHNGFSTTSDYTPNGGILYVIGDVMISSFAEIHGSIIATGNIHISGHAKITPTIDNIALATGSGDISNTSSDRITGLVYTRQGDYKQTANGILYGQLIVGGTVQKGGNSDIVFYQQSIPTPPGVDGVTPVKSLPIISAWQK